MENIIQLNKKNNLEYEKIMEELKSMILNNGIIWGEGLDEDNQSYRWVGDTKAVLLNPKGLQLTTELFSQKINNYKPNAVAGLTLASHIITSGIVYFSNYLQSHVDGYLIRRERKRYDMQKLVEGPVNETSNVVVVDDVLNQAGYAKQAIETIETFGCKVLAVIVLINFESTDFEYLKSKGYMVEEVFTLKELGLQTNTSQSISKIFELKWRYGTVNAAQFKIPKSSPIGDNGKIYVGSDQGKMLCLNLEGELLWEFTIDYDPEGIHSTPLIVGDKIIFPGYDGGMYALDKNKGTLIWKNKLCNWIGCSPTYDKETNLVYVGLENISKIGAMAALNVDDGNLIWEFTTKNHMACQACVHGNIIVFGSNDGFVYACNKFDGKLIWKYKTNAEVRGRILINDGLCYAVSFDGFAYCIELRGGKLVWKKKLGKHLQSGPSISDDKLIVGSFSNQLTALNKKTGEILWYFMTGDIIQSHPLCTGNRIYFGSYDGNIYVLDEASGNLLWKFITSGPVNSLPLIYENRLFVSANDGYLYCFEQMR